MEKSILARRKAQKLARDGQARQAIEEMRRLLMEGEPDPYDHVYLGDLLMKVGENDEAMTAYSEAVRSYEVVGLYRNAIAVGKKVLRIDHSRARIQRTLGELYDREGLKGEAVPHYLAYLDSFRGEALPPEEFFETLERASSLTGHQTEVALRLADHFVRVRQGDRAARFLNEVAAEIELHGTPELADELRRRAQEVETLGSVEDRGFSPRAAAPASATEGRAEAIVVDRAIPSAAPDLSENVEISAEDAPAPSSSTLPPPLPGPVPSGIRPEFDVLDFGARDLSGVAEPDGAASARAGDSADDSDGDSDDEAPRAEEQVFEIQTDEPLPPETAVAPSEAGEDVEQLGLVGRAVDAFQRGDWDTARSLYLHLHRAEPENRAHLGRLVEVAHKQGDAAGEALYLGFLGDIWIQEGAMERAVNIFHDMLRIDPGNQTAQRRLERLRKLGIPGAGPHLPGRIPNVLDSGEALVDVKDAADRAPGEEWLDLAGLLEEFKAGLENHVDASDFQAHYDLAVSHYQMGLLEEALEELDRVFACADMPGTGLPATVEQPARELRGICLMGLERSREAIHEFREAVEKSTAPDARRTALYHLARAFESVEDWSEACDTFEELVADAPGFLDAEARWQNCRDQADSSAARSLPPAA